MENINGNSIILTTKLGSNGEKELKKARKAYNRWRNSTKESKIYICTLFALAEGICPQCGKHMFVSFYDKHVSHPRRATLDHIIPISKVKEHKKYGFQIMCNECNHKKADSIQT